MSATRKTCGTCSSLSGFVSLISVPHGNIVTAHELADYVNRTEVQVLFFGPGGT